MSPEQATIAGILVLASVRAQRPGCGKSDCDGCVRKALVSALARLNVEECMGPHWSSLDPETLNSVTRATAEAMGAMTSAHMVELEEARKYHHVGHA